MADAKTVFVKGKVYWPKIVGDGALHDNYDGDAREWSYEFEPEDTAFLKEHKLLDRLKDLNDYADKLERRGEEEKAAKVREQAAGRGLYLNMRKPEYTKDGKKNDPIRIYKEDNTPWGDELIGNGTSVDAKLRIVDYGRGKKSGIYTTALRITDLVEYESNEFSGMDGDAPAPKTEKKTKAKAKAKPDADFDNESEDLDDDIPF